MNKTGWRPHTHKRIIKTAAWIPLWCQTRFKLTVSDSQVKHFWLNNKASVDLLITRGFQVLVDIFIKGTSNNLII